ncbi:MAG: acyl-protein synthetase [Defluviitaleaceae bacterium]|nr:acyl-protein synthetase [Defluviitaleaceae bacterium]
MIDYDKIFDEIKPFDLPRKQKEEFLTDTLLKLTNHHYQNCPEYRKILDALAFGQKNKTYSDIPFLPVRIFKEFNMKSVAQENVVKLMTSSGTTGQAVSRINVDRVTSVNQSKVMAKIVSSFISSARVPMIVIDTDSVLKNRNMFSARGGAILGFTMFGKDKLFALDENMQLKEDELFRFLDKHRGSEILLFGFTFMIWSHFCNELKKRGLKLNLGGSVLIHGGGWKKLADSAVTRQEFKDTLKEYCGIEKVHDYYGMVEQASSIYMECDYGHLHASSYSDIIIRRSSDFSVAGVGEAGIIQAVSISPLSYPGHSILTEDKGVMLGEDDCPCGRKGKYFEILGRVAAAEVRGCSDTYENKRAN